uniref:Uncharacterized protein n=1 Tax=Eutreptiella gymnastica TaxID=73025 RepID=A0A7S1I2T9_9EUGL
MFHVRCTLLGAWGTSRPHWLKGHKLGNWKRLVKARKTFREAKTEEERKINFRLGIDVAHDYTPPKRSIKAPKWLRDLRRQSEKAKSRLVPTTEAERLYLKYVEDRIHNPRDLAKATIVAKMWETSTDEMDINLAAKVLNSAWAHGAKLDASLFSVCIDACLRLELIEIAQYLVDNHRLLHFHAIHFDDVVRVRQAMKNANEEYGWTTDQLEENAPKIVKRYMDRLDTHLQALMEAEKAKAAKVAEG